MSGECGWASSPPAHSDLCASGYALPVTTQPLGTRLGSHRHAKEGEHSSLIHSNELVQHQNQESCAICKKRRNTFFKSVPTQSRHSQEKSSNDAELSWHRCLRTVKQRHESPRELGGTFGHPGRITMVMEWRPKDVDIVILVHGFLSRPGCWVSL